MAQDNNSLEKVAENYQELGAHMALGFERALRERGIFDMFAKVAAAVDMGPADASKVETHADQASTSQPGDNARMAAGYRTTGQVEDGEEHIETARENGAQPEAAQQPKNTVDTVGDISAGAKTASYDRMLRYLELGSE
jgi:hypothetical protein